MSNNVPPVIKKGGLLSGFSGIPLWAKVILIAFGGIMVVGMFQGGKEAYQKAALENAPTALGVPRHLLNTTYVGGTSNWETISVNVTDDSVVINGKDFDGRTRTAIYPYHHVTKNPNGTITIESDSTGYGGIYDEISLWYDRDHDWFTINDLSAWGGSYWPEKK